MGIIDYIRSIFSTNKKNATIFTTVLKKKYGEKDPLEIGLYDGKTPITNEDVGIEVNGKQYIRTTDNNGIARLNINLPVGKYSPKIYWRGNKDFNKTTAYTDIIIFTETYMEGIDLTKNYGDSDQYQCAVYRKDNNTRVKDTVKITINGVGYVREADGNGLYKLNINLNKGTYPIKAEFKGNDLFKPSYTNNTVTITEKPVIKKKKDIILGCDANTEDDKYVQDAIATKLRENGYSVEKLAIHPNAFASTDYSSKAKGKIGIYLIASGIFSIADANYGNGQFDNYIFGIRGDFGDRGATNFDIPIRADADCTSICDKLNGKTFNQMNRMLQPYVSIVGGANPEELGNNIVNWLNQIDTDEPTTVSAPEPKKQTELHDYITTQGSGKLGQTTPYSCGSHSLMQCIYRLTGIELSERKLMEVSGTTTDGVGHDGLETALAWFNREYNYNIKMTWKNKSELSWNEIQNYIDNGAVFFHLLYRNSDGHYEVAQNCNSPMDILNSLGDRDGNGYYGYIESRSRSDQQSYINGISQKSVCILTKG